MRSVGHGFGIEELGRIISDITGEAVVGNKLSGAKMQSKILERTIWNATYESGGVYPVARNVCVWGEGVRSWLPVSTESCNRVEDRRALNAEKYILSMSATPETK